MTLEKAIKIVDEICYDAEECKDCTFGIESNGEVICAFDKVYDVIKAEAKKERGFCKVLLHDKNSTLTIMEEDMDAVMEEITAYRRRKEK